MQGNVTRRDAVALAGGLITSMTLAACGKSESSAPPAADSGASASVSQEPVITDAVRAEYKKLMESDWVVVTATGAPMWKGTGSEFACKDELKSAGLEDGLVQIDDMVFRMDGSMSLLEALATIRGSVNSDRLSVVVYHILLEDEVRQKDATRAYCRWRIYKDGDYFCTLHGVGLTDSALPNGEDTAVYRVETPGFCYDVWIAGGLRLIPLEENADSEFVDPTPVLDPSVPTADLVKLFSSYETASSENEACDKAAKEGGAYYTRASGGDNRYYVYVFPSSEALFATSYGRDARVVNWYHIFPYESKGEKGYSVRAAGGLYSAGSMLAK